MTRRSAMTSASARSTTLPDRSGVVPGVVVMRVRGAHAVHGARRDPIPVAGALAGTTAAVSVGVGVLPVLAAAQRYGPVSTGLAVSVLAATAAILQPWAGKARDAGRIADRTGMAAGLALAAVGFILAAAIPTLPGILAAAVAIGAGTALATPLGFAHLASTTPPERMGQTMGAAEVGRELGDAGGPLLVGTIAAATTLSLGLYGLAAVLGLIALAIVPKRE